MYNVICTCTCSLMCGPIKGGLNPIDPGGKGGYGPAHSTRADRCIPRAKTEEYICLPECVDFGNVDLSKGTEVVPTLPDSIPHSNSPGVARVVL